MQAIVGCREMKELDGHTIEQMGMPSMVLMERAALQVVQVLERDRESLAKVLIVCGRGNNGGDGIAIGRLLHQKGYNVHLFCLGEKEKATAETALQEEIAGKYRTPFVNNPAWTEYTTIVDAVFGIGLKRDVTGLYAEVLQKMNAAGARKVAVDIPSGVDGDTGAVLGAAFLAEETVTFGFLKKGLCLYPGAFHAGKITVADIGISFPEGREPMLYALEKLDIKRLLPTRPPWGNKGTFGKVLLLTAGKGMSGAGYLCAQGSFAAGAGMVKIHTCAENRTIFQTLLPEAMVTAQEATPDMELLEKDYQWCDAVVAGPGLGSWGEELLLQLLQAKERKPLVLDADGLNVLSAHPDWKRYLKDHCVVTPHVGEMSRLSGYPTAQIKENLLETAEEFVQHTQVVCALKDARTVIAGGRRTYLNLSGNQGMATAGSGDVLAGIIGGLLAGGASLENAAAVGAFLHGLAGDKAREAKSARAMTAKDIPQFLGKLWKEIEEET